ncbi:hypothetical protein Tco_0299607 [Tanacetum coccineum]
MSRWYRSSFGNLDPQAVQLNLEEEMAPVRISSGPKPKMMFGQNNSSLFLHQMMFGQNSSSLVLHQMMSVQISLGLTPQCLKMFEHSSSSLDKEGETFSGSTKLQKNPIFCISVDIRQNINFVRAFTTLANVPSIYIQLFWNTLTHDVKTGLIAFKSMRNWLYSNWLIFLRKA